MTHLEEAVIWSQYRLGTDAKRFVLETSQQHVEASLALIGQARHSIDILAYALEAKIYHHRSIYDALRRFVCADKRNQVRILLHNSRNLVLRGHILLDLAERLSSFVSIKILSDSDRALTHGFLMADQTGYVLRTEALRYEGHADFNDRFQCRELIATYNAAWQRANSDPELRRLYI